MMMRRGLLGVVMVALMCSVTNAAEWGLKQGDVELKSAGSLAFGPDAILLVGDTKAAAVYAVDTQDREGAPQKVDLQIPQVGEKVASLLGSSPQATSINDLAVNPVSGNVYLSVTADKKPAIVRILASGDLETVRLRNIGYSKAVLPNPPEDKLVGEGRRRRNLREESITDLAFSDGKVLVSGLGAGESPSRVRSLDFPFAEADPGTSIEIFHGAHGRYEDYAAIRTFVPFNIGGEPNLLAGFTCTPLVKFPLPALESGKKVRGTTVAELGNRNRPLDMIVYEKNGQTYLLLTNSSRGVMKIKTNDIERPEGITEKIRETAGQEYETVESLTGIQQLDKLSDKKAIVLAQTEDGSLNLRTIELP